jgi:ferredoxin hydrogenase small subunit
MEIGGRDMKTDDRKHTYEESPFLVSRRQFIGISGIVVAAMAVPAVCVKGAIKRRNAYIRARAASLYRDDEQATVRVSHKNASVMKMYEEFAGHPLSEVSEELFHTHHYIDRHKI